MSHTHITAPTQYVEAEESGSIPPVGNRVAPHWCSWCDIRGGMDNSDRRSPTGWPRTGK